MSSRASGRRVVIVGGGIVGTAVADSLVRHADIEVTVLDRAPAGQLLGSTGHAPGYVSVVSESPVLSRLAFASAQLYDGLESAYAFERIGGLEVALSDSGMANLERRAGLAAQLDIEAVILDASRTIAAAPLFVNAERCHGGLLFLDDGAARGDLITGALRARAEKGGARFLDSTTVEGFDVESDQVKAVRTARGDRLEADDVVLAAGIWGREVAALAGEELVFAPVQHPYVYSRPRARGTNGHSPFVKWRLETVYARDHGDRLGIGTHDHTGVAAPTESMAKADLPWSEDRFGPALERAFDLLPTDSRFPIDRRLNGVFAMTADNLPLLGPACSIEGLWIAEALWITHAGGAAGALVDMILGRPNGIEGLKALAPGRFAGHDAGELTRRALVKYRDIWAPTPAPSKA